MNYSIRTVAIVFFISLLGFSSASAQGSLGKGNEQFNGGVGFSTWGVPIYLGVDFGVHQDVTIGPVVSYRNYSERFNSTRYSHSIFTLGFNGNYHFNTLIDLDPEWDLYAGLTLGYYIWSSPNDYIGAQASSVGLVGQIGGRYFFSDKFGVNVEFGGGIASGGKFGVTLKL